MLYADVFDYIENLYSFLMDLSKRSKYFLFNIPLELSLLSMLHCKKILKNTYKSVRYLLSTQVQLEFTY